MRPGTLRHRIILKRRAWATDNVGQPEETYTTYATVWANVRPLRGKEFVESGRAEAQVSHLVIMRYRSDLDPTDRIIHNGRTLEVNRIINIDEIGRTLEVMCTEVL